MPLMTWKANVQIFCGATSQIIKSDKKCQKGILKDGDTSGGKYELP